jgi:hypothetical protein
VTRGDHVVVQQRRVEHPMPRLFVWESVLVVLRPYGVTTRGME